MHCFLGNLHLEAAVVGAVCVVFMVLMVVAGVKQHVNDEQ